MQAELQNEVEPDARSKETLAKQVQLDGDFTRRGECRENSLCEETECFQWICGVEKSMDQVIRAK